MMMMMMHSCDLKVTNYNKGKNHNNINIMIMVIKIIIIININIMWCSFSCASFMVHSHQPQVRMATLVSCPHRHERGLDPTGPWWEWSNGRNDSLPPQCYSRQFCPMKVRFFSPRLKEKRSTEYRCLVVFPASEKFTLVLGICCCTLYAVYWSIIWIFFESRTCQCVQRFLAVTSLHRILSFMIYTFQSPQNDCCMWHEWQGFEGGWLIVRYGAPWNKDDFKDEAVISLQDLTFSFKSCYKQMHGTGRFQ